MSRYRKALNWEGMYAMAMDPDKARRYKEESEAAGSNVCSMCGSLCSINVDNAAIKFTSGAPSLSRSRSMPPRAENFTPARFGVGSRIALMRSARQPATAGGFPRAQSSCCTSTRRTTRPDARSRARSFATCMRSSRRSTAVIIGVSTDSVESHRRFAEKHALPFSLLADANGELARAFGVLRGMMASESTFVLGPDGRSREHSTDVTPRGHAQRGAQFRSLAPRIASDARRLRSQLN